MKDTIQEQAREEIRKALVKEYVRQHPDVKEQDVLLACIEGKLVFTHIAAALSDMKIRKNFMQSLYEAKGLFADLAIHQDERWQDCIASTQHSKMMIDCLYSSHFRYFQEAQWNEQHNFLRSQEEVCANKTVMLHHAAERLGRMKVSGMRDNQSQVRSLAIVYLKLVIDQLKVLHDVFQREVEVGDIFGEQSAKLIDAAFRKIHKKAEQTDLANIATLYRALKGDRKITIDRVIDLNEDMLHETKNTLTRAIDDLKKDLVVRREQFEQIWATMSAMQNVVKNLEEIQKLDEEGKLPPPDIIEADGYQPVRMMRFLDKFKRWN
ncbi:MAG: hypothetical protein AB1656_27200 [Candidatus Omnitrophota bacterium]